MIFAIAVGVVLAFLHPLSPDNENLHSQSTSGFPPDSPTDPTSNKTHQSERTTNAPDGSVASTNGISSSDPRPDPPTPDRPPIRTVRAFPDSVPDHPMSLNATESELKRIVNDSTKPLEVRSEASLRLDRGFSDWPGRKGNRLGGYLFEPERFSQLDGWAVSYDNLSLPTEWPHELALPVGVTRDLSLTKANAKLFVRISVAVSPQWAQYSLLQRTAMSSALPVLPRGGIITGGAIGDVLDSDVGVNAAVSSGDCISRAGTCLYVYRSAATSRLNWISGG